MGKMIRIHLCVALLGLAVAATECPAAGQQPAKVKGEPCQSLSLAPQVLPPARQGMPYSQQIQVFGGEAPVNLMLTAGGFPPGLAMSQDGVIRGTPVSSGDFSAEIRALDGCRPMQQQASRSYRILVADKSGAEISSPSMMIRQKLKVTIVPDPARLSIPAGKAGEKIPLVYKMTAQPAETAILASPGVSFLVAGSVIESAAKPLDAVLVNGEAAVAETITIPRRAIEAAKRERANILYNRAFSGRGTTAAAVVEITILEAAPAP